MLITVVLEMSGQSAYGIGPDRLEVIASATSDAVGQLIKPWSAQPREPRGDVPIGEPVQPLRIDKATATLGE